MLKVKLFMVPMLLIVTFLGGCNKEVDVNFMQDCSVRVTDGTGWGTGVFVGPDVIVTARHVAVNDPNYIVLNDGTKVEILDIYLSEWCNVAILKVDCTHAFVKLGTGVSLGETVYHVGNPLDWNWFNCVFKGIVCNLSVDWEIWEDGIIVDAWGAHGCSGGPVFNEDGELEAILCGGMSYGSAICEPIDHILKTLDEYNALN